MAGCVNLKLTHPRVRLALRSRLDLITDSNVTLRAKLRKAILQGFEAGESEGQIADRLRKQFKLSRARARMISRTAIGGAQNDGHEIQIEETFGKKYRKEWITARDGLVRESHDVLDGEVVDAEGYFSNGLLRPLEFGAPPEEVINCRCILLYHPKETA